MEPKAHQPYSPTGEDRHGEMTGAISINMMLSMLPVTIWAVYVGPWLLPFGWSLTVALALAVVLPLAMLPLSRRLWGWLSRRMES
ncbi:MAG: hypothetical protein IT440_12965 [Phycisphaeraceae bacterium]|nr:hypothetical protein [Phycisphaeraceae bacterium]